MLTRILRANIRAASESKTPEMHQQELPSGPQELHSGPQVAINTKRYLLKCPIAARRGTVLKKFFLVRKIKNEADYKPPQRDSPHHFMKF